MNKNIKSKNYLKTKKDWLKRFTFLQRYSFLLILAAYLLINLIFNFKLWRELIFDSSKVGARYGEVLLTEYTGEVIYQNIMSGKNPFAHTYNLLYPFGANFALSDSGPGNGFYFLLLRPFLSEHQSLAFIVVVSIFASCLGMYLLLRRMKITVPMAFLFGLVFGFSTFLSQRIGGHQTYTNLYVFPWFLLSAHTLFTTTRLKTKLIASVGIAIITVLTLWANVYYFVALILLVFFYFVYYFLFRRDQLISAIAENFRFLSLTVVIITVFLLPWLVGVYQTFLFKDFFEIQGWGGAIQYSSDIFGFFVPSQYNPLYRSLVSEINKQFQFTSGIFENFTYPGIFILASLFFYLFFRRRLPTKIRESIKPHLFVGLAFAVLTLGPFLHIAGRWFLTVGEEIRVVLPLPYVIFHQLPFMENIRVPGRLIPPGILAGTIVAAVIFNYFWQVRLRSKFLRWPIFAVLLAVFFVDQFYTIPSPAPTSIPKTAYKIIHNDPERATVLEVPFLIRNGFVYFGKNDRLEFMGGQMVHGKPIIGGYMGRVGDAKFDYYKRNPFIGFVARLIDKDLENNGFVDQSDIDKWKEIDIEKAEVAVDFLDIGYIILDTTESYADQLARDFTELGFKKISEDGDFLLFEKKPSEKEYLSVMLGNDSDDIFLAHNWSAKDDGFRWTHGNIAQVLFKVARPRAMNLTFQGASFGQPQKVKVYLGFRQIGEVEMGTEMTDFILPIPGELKQGINFITFRFSHSARVPQDLIDKVNEQELTAKFEKVALED